MFNASANAAAVGRVNKRVKDRHNAAYREVFSTEEGRAFISEMIEMSHFYEPVETPEHEGMRQLVACIRREALSLGLFDKWQQAEKEAADFAYEMRTMIEQSESKEEEEDYGL
ncbi:MAG: hypothetical protein II430_02960 [Selenomonas sp.]|nr:hypothetical protein [Selenomonas sp.]